jgi:hypothetical protein
MTLWETVVVAFVAFVALAFLGALAMVTADLIRNTSMRGRAKATWVVLFLFLPVLSVVAYVATNGRGMADRIEGRTSHAGG